MLEITDPTMSFTKSKQAVAGTLAKFKIAALTNFEHCIRGTAAPPANDDTHSYIMHTKEVEDNLLINLHFERGMRYLR